MERNIGSSHLIRLESCRTDSGYVVVVKEVILSAALARIPHFLSFGGLYNSADKAL
jgi:hypothetical protein